MYFSYLLIDAWYAQHGVLRLNEKGIILNQNNKIKLMNELKYIEKADSQCDVRNLVCLILYWHVDYICK